MKHIFFGITVALFGFAFSVSAEQIPATSKETITSALKETIKSAFHKYKEISATTINVPTVVEVSLPNDFSNRFDFAVLDTGSNVFQPYLFIESLRTARAPVSVSVQDGDRMLDGDTRTFTEFTLP